MFKFLIVLYACVNTCLYAQAANTSQSTPSEQNNVDTKESIHPTIAQIAWRHHCSDPQTLVMARETIDHMRATGQEIRLKDLLDAENYARCKATAIDVFVGPDRPEYNACQEFIAYVETVLEEERSKIATKKSK
jgi:hypothetical protein